MSHSILEKAIKVITYLQEQSLHNTVDGPIYIPKEYIDVLENLLVDYNELLLKIKEKEK